MSQIISRFISQVQNRFANSQSIEHAYRSALQDLKDLIKIAVNHIDSEEKLSQFVERMPQGK